MPVVLLLLALVAGCSWLTAAAAAAACPAVCDCRWRNGKESVTCVGANLSQVPAKLDAGTQVLNLSGNHLTAVPADAFRTAGLLNLQKVFLARCRIQILDKYAFRKLKNLVELDLSYNALSSVPSHVFASIPELRELRLSGNPIQRVLNDAFAHLKVTSIFSFPSPPTHIPFLLGWNRRNRLLKMRQRERNRNINGY